MQQLEQELAEVARCVELQRATVTAVCCRCIEFLIINLQSSPQVKNATPGRSAPTILNVTIIHGPPSNGYLHGVNVDVTFESGYASRHFCTMKTKKSTTNTLVIDLYALAFFLIV